VAKNLSPLDLGLKRLSQKVQTKTIRFCKCLNSHGEEVRRVRLGTLLRQPLKTEECATSLFKSRFAPRRKSFVDVLRHQFFRATVRPDDSGHIQPLRMR
jgi:hypothetical protein